MRPITFYLLVLFGNCKLLQLSNQCLLQTMCTVIHFIETHFLLYAYVTRNNFAIGSHKFVILFVWLRLNQKKTFLIMQTGKTTTRLLPTKIVEWLTMFAKWMFKKKNRKKCKRSCQLMYVLSMHSKFDI